LLAKSTLLQKLRRFDLSAGPKGERRTFAEVSFRMNGGFPTANFIKINMPLVRKLN